MSRTADGAAVALRCWYFKKERMLHVNIYFLRMQMQGVIACTVLSDVERPAADVCIEMLWPICVGIATGSRVSLSMTLAAQLTHSLPLLSVCLPHSLTHSLSHFCSCSCSVIMAIHLHLSGLIWIKVVFKSSICLNGSIT